MNDQIAPSIKCVRSRSVAHRPHRSHPTELCTGMSARSYPADVYHSLPPALKESTPCQTRSVTDPTPPLPSNPLTPTTRTNPISSVTSGLTATGRYVYDLWLPCSYLTRHDQLSITICIGVGDLPLPLVSVRVFHDREYLDSERRLQAAWTGYSRELENRLSERLTRVIRDIMVHNLMADGISRV